MSKDASETQQPTKPRHSPFLVDNSWQSATGQIDRLGAYSKIWEGVVVVALIGACAIGLVVSKQRTKVAQWPSPEQQRIDALSEQLCSLRQTDLIVFPDGRVWYVRSVRGKNLEVVGWVGANTRTEDIDSFVLREDHLTIVHRNDAAWPIERDRFLNQ
jgi:hypothetical protein